VERRWFSEEAAALGFHDGFLLLLLLVLLPKGFVLEPSTFLFFWSLRFLYYGHGHVMVGCVVLVKLDHHTFSIWVYKPITCLEKKTLTINLASKA
jgi:hypothetical protein